MKDSANGSYRYQVGGALGQDVPSYVARAADRQFYEALQAQEFCYVLNSRQMGKSSLMVRTLARLKSEGWEGIVLDFSAKDSQVEQAERWYNGIINQLNRHFRLLDNARTWLKERDFLSPVERLEEFIETVLLPGINQRIVIFIDEIDSTLNLPFTDDFFALIRACYNKRADNADYKRLTFALLGVAAPAELISDKKRTPFNIGQAIDLKGFGFEEAQPLVKGLETKADNPQAVLAEILKWTGGQPFLSQRLCQLVVDNTEFISAGKEAEFIDKLTQDCLIDNWESQDEQEHLKTIRNRLLSNEQKAAYLLELYRQIRQAGKLKFQNTSEERDLQLSGLVVKRDDCLTVYNPIYEQVFNEQWINTGLGKLRPYAENFRFWVASGGTDESRLLRGKALQEAEEWAQDKNLSYQDKQFLAASKEKEIQEQIAAQAQEAALEWERQDRKAAEARNQLLSEANKKAQQRIRIGTIVFILSLLVALISWKRVEENSQYLVLAKSIAEKAEELQSNGNNLIAKESLIKASLAVNIQDNNLKLALLYNVNAYGSIALNLGYQQENKYILLGNKHLNLAKESNDKLQVRIIHNLNKIRLLEKHLWTVKPNIISSKKQFNQERNKYYFEAFHYFQKLKNSNKVEKKENGKVEEKVVSSPFNPKIILKILSEEDIEDFHRKFIDLLSEISFGNEKFKQEVEESLKEHYYDELDNLLKNRKWKAANSLTSKLMFYMPKREEQNLGQINNFSCPDLRKIDQLWVSNSDKLFGFSVQKEIWISTENRLGIKPEDRTVDDTKNSLRFAKRVGWLNERVREGNDSSWSLSDDKLIKHIIDNPKNYRGGLPKMEDIYYLTWGETRTLGEQIAIPRGVQSGSEIFSRVAICKL